MAHVIEQPADRAGERLLDPFSFHPSWRSAIRGLGGAEPANDPAFAFHTPYVEVAPGLCNFTVRFDGLAARYGVLQLRVHMIAAEPGSVARMANMDRIALNRLVQLGGEVSIRFEGFRGYAFALMALVPDETDAQALGLSVVLDRPAEGHDADEAAGDGRTSAYGRDAARPATHLVVADPPSFASPVSQPCTARQLAEPAFREVRRELASPAGDELDGWRPAYVLQVLRRYGMLAEGARGLGFGLDHGDRGLSRALAAQGPALTATGFAGDAGLRRVDPDALPRDLVDFDFLWSVDALGALPTAEAGVRFVEEAMRCLRPGGLAVHVMPFALDASSRGVPLPGPTYRRGDVERMGLLAISRNHEVAQIKVDLADAVALPDRDRVGAFGLVLRRAPSIL